MKRNFMKGALVITAFAVAGMGIHLATATFISARPEEASLANVSAGSAMEAAAVGEFHAPREITGADKETSLLAPKDLNVQAAYVVDLSSGDEIFSVNKGRRWPLASLSKLMTAVVSLENYPLEDEVVMSESAIAFEGSAGGLALNERYSVNDLVTAMMVVSSNDAAAALEEKLPEGQFVELMNQKALELGMTNTHFAEPSGLSSLNQSTLEDMSRLLSYAWGNHSELFVVSSRTKGYIKELNSKKKRALVNINALAPRSNFLGGKTGYTDEARQNLVSVFSFNKRPLGIMILGAEDRVAEADKIIKFLAQ